MSSLQDLGLFDFPLLSEQEVSRLLKKVRKGDLKAREKLINSNLRLVLNIVKRFEVWGYEREELFQIGVIGLIKAIDNFDPSRGVKFSTYAVPMIIGEIRRFLRDDQPIKVSRALRESGFRVKKVRAALERKLGREPTINEIAQEMGIAKEEVVMAMEVMQAPSSVFEPLYQSNGDHIRVLDSLSSDKDQESFWCEEISLKEALGALPARERQIIWMRFFLDKTQTDIASALGLSQVQVSRLERKAVEMLRKLLSH
ncbi:MAG: RNA polymerase sigma factor [Thermoanaerobacterales bacterium 50_218]|nr:MAG: RNA polymerase sigma factor [Thermoanaerobacterales bacterium 50_218]HAA90434.1 RNA polymerase sigma-G factor [Peptococcaceae bacterium]